jgi:hypothetical protein
LIAAVAAFNNASPAVPIKESAGDRAFGEEALQRRLLHGCARIEGLGHEGPQQGPAQEQRAAEDQRYQDASDGVLEGVERPVHEPEGQQAANYGAEAEEGGDKVEASADEGQVG